jgi:hypothetical protein
MRLTVTPLGADVTLGSKWYGQISADGLIITVNAGNYKLKVTKAGYYPFSSIVSLPAGSTPLNPQPFDVVLTPVPTTTTIPRATTTTLPSDGTGTIKLTSAPSGASVYFDVSLPSPPLFGVTPLVKSGAPAGVYNLVIKLDGYSPSSIRFGLKAGQSLQHHIVLVPTDNPTTPDKWGTLMLSTNPSGADFMIDGSQVDRSHTSARQTPAYIYELSPGLHQVMVYKGAISPITQNVNIIANTVVPLDLVFPSGSNDDCVDSDNGINPYDIGTIRPISSRAKPQADKCLTQTRLLEGYCLDGKMSTVGVTCDAGCNIPKGVCNRPSIGLTRVVVDRRVNPQVLTAYYSKNIDGCLCVTQSDGVCMNSIDANMFCKKGTNLQGKYDLRTFSPAEALVNGVKLQLKHFQSGLKSLPVSAEVFMTTTTLKT